MRLSTLWPWKLTADSSMAQHLTPACRAKPVGRIRTCFPKKNGCPRQGSVCPNSVAHLDLTFGNNPHHGADGLADYSHVWLLFLFDLNGTDYTPRPRVMPPRLRGKTMGVFATRSPHRCCASAYPPSFSSFSSFFSFSYPSIHPSIHLILALPFSQPHKLTQKRQA